ncbi:glutathione S-transferase family protein [Mangrovicoccus sp. HB161399]|uniref:glutathione S-transferase family protein n=1 Tax=Mangrovicoccus sp. HB161399 TaxID=2720392 RepID=UPI001553AC75|nr:glutathione S-transferase family protein [Mangrovicoccus sp. HB161399]
MTDLVLYTNPMSRGRIARWLMEEAGQPYDTVVLDYGTTMKAPEYLAINPMGKVPALVHGDRVVTENAAICAYMADAFPGAGLAPDPMDRADYYRWLFFAAGPLEQAVTNASVELDTSDPSLARRFGYGTLGTVLDTLDGFLDGRAYVCGDRFSAADVMLGMQLHWGMAFHGIPSRPSFTAYAARLASRPAFLRASELDDALAAAGG